MKSRTKRERRLTAGVLIVLLLATALAGCDLLALFRNDRSFTFRSEDLLRTNGHGHFEKDQVYTYVFYQYFNDIRMSGKSVYTYAADGSYAYLYYIYEHEGADINENGTSGEGYFLFRGGRGTYTYDRDALELTTMITGFYSSYNDEYDDTTGTWISTWKSSPGWFNSSWGTNSTDELFFTARHRDNVYRAMTSGWVHRRSYTHNPGSEYERRYDHTTELTITMSQVDYLPLRKRPHRLRWVEPHDLRKRVDAGCARDFSGGCRLRQRRDHPFPWRLHSGPKTLVGLHE